MVKAQLENLLRNQYLELVTQTISNQVDVDPLPISASELAIPCLDAEGNEAWVVIKITIPRGKRNGNGGYDPYNGYALAEDYQEALHDRAEKKAAVEAKKQAKIAKDEQKRAEKKALAEAKKGLQELKKIKVTPQE